MNTDLATLSTLDLAILIGVGLLLQGLAFAGVALYRHLLRYRALVGRLEQLQSDPPSDPDLQLPRAPAAWSGLRALRVDRKEREDAAGTVCSFYLSAVDGQALPPFSPGQFLTFRIPVPVGDSTQSKPLVRCYSLSDRPGRGHYRISVKRALSPAPGLPPGLVSNHLHDQVQVGAVLEARAPGGVFVLPLGPGPVVLIAGGIGITPLLSMASASLERGDGREIHLFYGVRCQAELAFRSELDALSARHPTFHLHLCLSAPGPDDLSRLPGATPGRLDIGRLRLTLPLREFHFYLCGPGPMLEGLLPGLRAWGVPDHRIHSEQFGPSALRPGRVEPAAAGPTLQIHFRRSGRTAVWDGSHDSLLSLAESVGVSIDSGCRSGSCGSCQTRIESGQTRTGKVPDFEVDPGHCLMCVSQPTSDLSLSA